MRADRGGGADGRPAAEGLREAGRRIQHRPTPGSGPRLGASPHRARRRRAAGPRAPRETGSVREDATRIDGRLEATLRVPDTPPSAIVVIAHPLPTHGGTMRNPVV